MRAYPIVIAFFLIGSLQIGIIRANAFEAMPRIVIGLYDGKSQSARSSIIHKAAEMPLNYLGLKVRYQDVWAPLPKLKRGDGVLGVLYWFSENTVEGDPETMLNWLIEALDQKKKVVLFGSPGLKSRLEGNDLPQAKRNQLHRRLGFVDQDLWNAITYDDRLDEWNPGMIGFEHTITGLNQPYQVLKKIDRRVVSHLAFTKVHDPNYRSEIIFTGPHGGYVAPGYSRYVAYGRDMEFQQWLINPFLFFRAAFDTDPLPKPDPTTIAGRRIYYSHIDGDGWNNYSQMEEHRKKRVLSAEVVLEKIIRPYPDLPITVGPVVGDLDPDWFGTKRSMEVAKEIFRQPQVEIGSHTYSHPFSWSFFADGDPEKERPFLKRYPGDHWGRDITLNNVLAYFFKNQDEGTQDGKVAIGKYAIPRAYAVERFNIVHEIKGGIDFLNELAPPGKKVEVMLWSGDTEPFAEAFDILRELDVANINGGDTRFDDEFPSYMWVSAVGYNLQERHRQIYASSSNENTYTDLWRDWFHRFQFLHQTHDRTEFPYRVKPINVYYHIYSGERKAGLAAVLMNLESSRKRELAPVTTSHYSRIADGFYTTQIYKIAPNQWKIEDRGASQTLRFDGEEDQEVDFARSIGVIGQRQHNNHSLYVYLDQTEKSPVVALRPLQSRGKPATVTHLNNSRWPIWGVRRKDQSIEFKAQGFGYPEFVFRTDTARGKFHFTIESALNTLHEGTVESLFDGTLILKAPIYYYNPVTVTVTPVVP